MCGVLTLVSETPCICQLWPLLLLLLCIIKRAKTCVHYKNHCCWRPAVILHQNKTWYKQFIQPEAKDHQEQKRWLSLLCQYPKSQLSWLEKQECVALIHTLTRKFWTRGGCGGAHNLCQGSSCAEGDGLAPPLLQEGHKTLRVSIKICLLGSVS